VNVEEKLAAILAAIQVDVGNRGLAHDPVKNLFNAFPWDFAAACRSLAEHPAPVLGVITGFYIPSVGQGETDGPLGAVYLARTLPLLGIRVQLASDPFCRPALLAGLQRAGCIASIPVSDLPPHAPRRDQLFSWWQLDERYSPGTLHPPTHLLAIERAGPSHTPDSLRARADSDEETVQRFLAEVPTGHHDRCHTMRGIDITDHMRDAAFAFESHPPASLRPVTIGIGDGGNEIGMGKVPWEVIRCNIPRGGLIACRIATDHLLVAGVSNWGAYALAAGVALLRGKAVPDDWLDRAHERSILEDMVAQGPLVDGVSGTFTVAVDGLPFETYARPLQQIASILRA
jgi:hypothetical protein